MTEQLKDVFLSHTSTDKEKFVRPLAQALTEQGITYWLDEAEIRWGDKITKKINEGLKRSRYVIVFLSDNFLGRNWPEAELEAALNKETTSGRTIVLPILIGDPEKIIDHYPLLRDKLFLQWDLGLATIVEHLTSLVSLAKDQDGLVQNSNSSTSANVITNATGPRSVSAKPTNEPPAISSQTPSSRLRTAVGSSRARYIILAVLGSGLLMTSLIWRWPYSAVKRSLAGATASPSPSLSPSPIVKPAPVPLADQIALAKRGFWFDYPHPDPGPGRRYWLQMDDYTWIERYPDGTQTTFRITGPARVRNVAGIFLLEVQGDLKATQVQNNGSFQVFIPDKDSGSQEALFRHFRNGQWGNWGSLCIMNIIK